MAHPEGRIALLRHGETEWSREGRHTSHSDVALTPRGRAQARQATALLGGLRLGLTLCSPLRRARETAALAGLGMVALRDGLREWDYGDYEGRTSAEIRAERPGWRLWRDGCPGGESLAAAAERVDAVIDEAHAAAAGGDDVLLVAHGHILRILGARWIGLPPGEGGHLVLDTGTLSLLGAEHAVPAILGWNLAAVPGERG